MIFEFDSEKNKINEEKHGIDFKEAQKLWKDDKKIILAARYAGEERRLLIGKINNAYWAAVFVRRNKKVRIIFVRKARKNERERYNSRRI